MARNSGSNCNGCRTGHSDQRAEPRRCTRSPVQSGLWRTTQKVAQAAAVDHLRRLSPRKCGVQGPQRSGTRAAACRGNRVFALSAAVDGEIAGVLNRPRFARAILLARRERVLESTASMLRKAKASYRRPSALNWIACPADNLRITKVLSLLHCSRTALLAAFAAPCLFNRRC
jgi:hypothetical protein